MIDYSDDAVALDRVRYLTSLAVIPEADPCVIETTIHIPTRDNHHLETVVYRPRTAGHDLSPIAVLYHAGAHSFGFPAMVHRTARLLVKEFGMVVVAPSYRLAPEYKFPNDVNDAWDVLVWLTKNAFSLQAELSKGFIIGGNSNGGTLAIVLSHLARDRKLEPCITGLYSSCSFPRLAEGMTLQEKHASRILSPTQDEIVNDKLGNVSMDTMGEALYGADKSSELYAPLLWPGELGHRGLPPVYSQVCGREAARDLALVLDDLLKDDEVPTRLDLYQGLPHCFWYPFKQHSRVAQWERDTIGGFKWLLER